MFKCSLTGNISAPCEKPITVISKKRQMTYNGGSAHGWEIVKELKLTKEGYDLFLATHKEEEFTILPTVKQLSNFSDSFGSQRGKHTREQRSYDSGNAYAS